MSFANRYQSLVSMYNNIGITRPELDPESTDLGVHAKTYGTRYYGTFRAPMPHLSNRDEIPFWDAEDRMIKMLDASEDAGDAYVAAPENDRYSSMAEEHGIGEDYKKMKEKGNVLQSASDSRLASTTVRELLGMLGSKTVTSPTSKGLRKQALLTHGWVTFTRRPFSPSASWKDTTEVRCQYTRHKPAHTR